MRKNKLETAKKELETAKKELEKMIENQTFTLFEIRDAAQTISDLGARGFSYAFITNTYKFFKKLGFKADCISAYYKIEI